MSVFLKSEFYWPLALGNKKVLMTEVKPNSQKMTLLPNLTFYYKL